jgi:PAS domain S-box-containing protein
MEASAAWTWRRRSRPGRVSMQCESPTGSPSSIVCKVNPQETQPSAVKSAKIACQVDPLIQATIDVSDPVDLPSVVCKLDGRVVWVNAAWMRLCGFSREEIIDHDLEKLHGPGTDQAAVRTLMQHLAKQQPCSAELICYDRAGLPFKHTMRVVPLQAPDGSPRLFRVTSDAVTQAPEMVPASPVVAPVSSSTSFFGSLFGGDAEVVQEVDHLSACVPRAIDDGAVVVLTQPQPPYAIVWASPGWLSLCGFSSLAEVAGRTLSIIQGSRTDRAAVGRLMEAVRCEQSADGISLVNYDKQRRPFRHTLRVTPVRSRSLYDVVAYCASSTGVCPLHYGCRLPPALLAEPTEEEYWGEEMESYFMRWSHVGEALIAQECSRLAASA